MGANSSGVGPGGGGSGIAGSQFGCSWSLSLGRLVGALGALTAGSAVGCDVTTTGVTPVGLKRRASEQGASRGAPVGSITLVGWVVIQWLLV